MTLKLVFVAHHLVQVNDMHGHFFPHLLSRLFLSRKSAWAENKQTGVSVSLLHSAVGDPEARLVAQ